MATDTETLKQLSVSQYQLTEYHNKLKKNIIKDASYTNDADSSISSPKDALDFSIERIADRTYAKSIGLGYVLLDKNKTFASQVTEDNTIYEIRYVFDLSAESVTIPSGCILKFEGGSVYNGTITGTNTHIEATALQIFGENLTLSGTWNVTEAYPEWFGSVGDLSTDDTKSLQSTLNTFERIYFKGTYCCGNLDVPSNRVITFSTEAHLKELSGSIGTTIDDRGCILKISGKSNIVIHGNNAKITMLKDEHVAGNEWNHAISITGSTNVKIYDINTYDAGGDGYYIGGNTHNENVTLSGCTADGSKRNGLSIVNAKNLLVENCCFKNTSGATAGPWAGIDIESNADTNDSYDYYIQNVSIIGCSTYGNTGSGLQITPQHHKTEISCEISNFTSVNDRNGFRVVNIVYADGDATTKLNGFIHLQNILIDEPQQSAIGISRNTELSPVVKAENIVIRNVGSSGDTTNRKRCGIIIRSEVEDFVKGTSEGNIAINGLKLIDDRDTTNTFAVVYGELLTTATNPLKNFILTDVEYSVDTITEPFRILKGDGSSDVLETENVIFKPISPFQITGFDHSKYYGYVKIKDAGSVTLPESGHSIGTEIKVCCNGTSNLIAPTDEYINYNGLKYPMLCFNNNNIDDYIILRDTANGWEVVEICGAIKPSSSVTSFMGAKLLRGSYDTDVKRSLKTAGDIMLNIAKFNSITNFVGWINRSTSDGTQDIKYLPPIFSIPFHATTTSKAPTSLTTDDKGYVWFNTSLNKPLWWTGEKWVDATGEEWANDTTSET